MISLSFNACFQILLIFSLFICYCILVIVCLSDFLLLFDLILYAPSTIFQLNRDRSSWVEQVLSWINVSYSRTQHSDAGEARTRTPSV